MGSCSSVTPERQQQQQQRQSRRTVLFPNSVHLTTWLLAALTIASPGTICSAPGPSRPAASSSAKGSDGAWRITRLRDLNASAAEGLAGRASDEWETGLARDSAGRRRKMASCSVADGRWVPDYSNRPAYTPTSCPFLRDIDYEVNVLKVLPRDTKKGSLRDLPDFRYIFYSWEPAKSCKLQPRKGASPSSPSSSSSSKSSGNPFLFDAAGFLRMMRGKTLTVVGDSLVHWNLFYSLLCQVHSSFPVNLVKTFAYGNDDRVKVFHVPSHNVFLINSWSRFLVKQNASKPNSQGKIDYLLHTKVAGPWQALLPQTDVLVLQSLTHWLLKNPSFKPPTPSGISRDKSLQIAYKDGMTTVRKRVVAAVRSRRRGGRRPLIPYFMTIPPAFRKCRSYKHPFRSTRAAMRAGAQNPQVTEWEPLQRSVFGQLPFRLLPVTKLSLHRPDAQGSGCIHYKLPGVPDSWVDVLYTLLQSDLSGR